MKRAIVLSGGGAKGAYQMGFWKAIRQLNISYDIVTGTSIGALNGALMVQKSYFTAYRLWYFMNYNRVYDRKTSSEFSSDNRDIMMKYAKKVIKGGLDVENLEKTIRNSIKPRLFYNSKIDYGLITVKFPSLKPVILTKDKIEKDLLCDYLVASASCFPAFKMKNINNKKYIDGGYYDNLPINLAISMGADEVIAVNLKEVGNVKKVKNKNIKVKIIEPNNDIGNFLIMDKNQSRRAIKFGYNDTMKAFGKLEGAKYTFKPCSIEDNFNYYYDYFCDICKKHLNKEKYSKVSKFNATKFNDILERLALSFNINETEIYTMDKMNYLISKYYDKYIDISLNDVLKKIKERKLSKRFLSKEIIILIYRELNKKRSKILKSIIDLLPDSVYCAIYLKTVIDKEKEL